MAEKSSKINYYHMKLGLVLGKFMPVHNGHLALIDFALDHCDELVLLLCHHSKEPISGEQREKWLKEIYKDNANVRIVSFSYDPLVLTDSSVSSPEASEKWALRIKDLFPLVSVVFSSEKYGDHLANYLGVKHIPFDCSRISIPISASDIREHSFRYWNHIPAVVRPWFVKKVSILGSESTGKSSLAKKLAAHYGTVYVPEMAREIVSHTKQVRKEELYTIAEAQATAILEKQKVANKILYLDTDLIITQSYARFLFNDELIVEHWIEEANMASLYLYLNADCPYIQDGTRLEKDERDRLDEFHRMQLAKHQINYITISGNWEERFKLSTKLIDHFILKYS